MKFKDMINEVVDLTAKDKLSSELQDAILASAWGNPRSCVECVLEEAVRQYAEMLLEDLEDRRDEFDEDEFEDAKDAYEQFMEAKVILK